MSDTIEVLIGSTLKAVEVSEDKRKILFTIGEEEKYKLYHDQDCCKDVTIEEIIGDLDNLVGSPILRAEMRSDSDKMPEGAVKVPEYLDHYTWTFYELATIKGSVTLRWWGNSNGYYSEEVNFKKLT